MVAVTGRISGRDLGSTIRDVQAVLAKPGRCPRRSLLTLGGTYAEQQKAFAGLLAVFAGGRGPRVPAPALPLRKFPHGDRMLAMTLLALSAVTIGLWLTGTELNISSMMGMTMIVGIATEVAIFYVSEYA